MDEGFREGSLVEWIQNLIDEANQNCYLVNYEQIWMNLQETIVQLLWPGLDDTSPDNAVETIWSK